MHGTLIPTCTMLTYPNRGRRFKLVHNAAYVVEAGLLQFHIRLVKKTHLQLGRSQTYGSNYS